MIKNKLIDLSTKLLVISDFQLKKGGHVSPSSLRFSTEHCAKKIYKLTVRWLDIGGYFVSMIILPRVSLIWHRYWLAAGRLSEVRSVELPSPRLSEAGLAFHTWFPN